MNRRPLIQTDDQTASIRTVVAASAIGATIEWYDFLIYATAASLDGANDPMQSTCEPGWPSGLMFEVGSSHVTKFKCRLSPQAAIGLRRVASLIAKGVRAV
jgi:hypothetical protein